MKHIIYIITALLLCTVSVQAQRRDYPALQITLQDGTKDTLFIGTNGLISMYGLNNATCDDYISKRYDSLIFSYKNFHFLESLRLTRYGGEAEYEGFGRIVADKPIDDNMSIKEIGTSPRGEDCSMRGCLYINDDKELWFPCISVYGRDDFDFYNSDYENVLTLKYGATYYWRPFYLLDGKTYLGEEETVRCPKLVSYVIMEEDIQNTIEQGVVYNNESEVRNRLQTYYDSQSVYLDSISQQYFKDYCHSLTEEQIAAIAMRTEVCDDGTLYFINIPDSEVEKMIADIDKEGNTPFYVQGNNETTVFMRTKATKIVTCDEKWGVRDNQYITSDTLATTSVRPDVYVKLDHVMLPGKTYNITVTIAPQTDETKEIKPLYIRLDILNKDYDDNTFTNSAANTPGMVRLNVPDATKVIDEIIAEGDKVNTYTVQYTPTQLVYYNAFAISHIKHFVTAANRNKYEQHIRLVGVEVAPAE